MTRQYILPQGYGYGFALGVGALFALLMASITYILNKYANDHQDSENFTTASRTVKTGLMASAVISSWTWPATLLTSGAWAYTYGVQGSFWYAILGVFWILVMALVATEIKRKSPGAHTVGEIVKARFGTGGHIVYMCYVTGCNIIVSVMVLLGGSQGFNAATGMNVAAASFLLPLGVIFYTVSGGIKATFLSDWIHTVIIYVIIVTVVFNAYATNDLIGSPSKMYDLLVEVAEKFPSPSDNGSYFSFRCSDFIMLVWGVFLGTSASVFGDPSYGQKAIAASPKAAMASYYVGGICWFLIPWGLGTSAGLSALALTNNPASFTYPNLISEDAVGKGLPVIYGMGALLGNSGAAAALCMLFMSVTSALSAELIGISSILTYDVYRAYINPKASGKSLVNVSHIVITCWGIAMGALSIGFDNAGVTVGWILGVLGIILNPVSSGLVMTLYYTNMSKWTVLTGMPLGTAGGIAVWTTTAYGFYGAVNKDTLGLAKPSLCANFASLFIPVAFGVVFSSIWPQRFDFDSLNQSFVAGDDATESELMAMKATEQDKKILARASKLGMSLVLAFFLVFFFLIPITFYGTSYTFSKGFFTGWIVIMIIWLICAFLFITIYPIYESYEKLIFIARKVLGRGMTEKNVNPEQIAADSTSTTDKKDDITEVAMSSNYV